MAKKTYVGVNNIARNVSKMYVGVNGVARKVKKAYVGVNGVARQFYQDALKIVTFNSGTDKEIYDMLVAHYEGRIDVSNYWSVGDNRTIHLSAMNAQYAGESHRAQDMVIEIVDFKHDDLWTSINGITKAAISVACKNCLRDATVSDTQGSSNSENGYMNPTRTYIGGWANCDRRRWCNNVFYNALPYYIKMGVKEVKKLSYYWEDSSNYSSSNSNNLVFLPSATECLGNVMSVFREGTRYARYTTQSNLRKLPKWTSSDVSSNYFTRTAYELASVTTKTQLVEIIRRADTGNDAGYADSVLGISPMFCM